MPPKAKTEAVTPAMRAAGAAVLVSWIDPDGRLPPDTCGEVASEVYAAMNHRLAKDDPKS